KNLGFKLYKSKSKTDFFKVLIKVIKKENVNIVHSHMFLASGIIMLVSKMFGVEKRISHLRSTGNGKDNNLKNKLMHPVLKGITVKYSTNILGVSKAVLRTIFNDYYSNNKFVVLYNGFK